MAEWHDFPVPTLMVVGGVVVGLLVALLSRLAAAVGARRRAGRAARRLRRSVEAVARERVVAPVDAVIADLGRARDAARRAAA
ncbi:hypothetical protein D1825_01775 [Cellulomonas rhizosphaerae]|uniref:Uncharacterized protein n=1 Tax=Cellulomonas rhizosphaerae TaxID=2293719 RepID=A0A413RQX9_9CELL|nr:hypothetical protein D1825_01775 [Cellulomonas rhizosphaerae]